jgi:hypothetical protein
LFYTLKETHPNAVLIGVQKAGTTALYNWISQHPQVFGNPAMKDFPFFCNAGYFDKGEDWFAQRFSRWSGQKIILHGYVHYLFFAEQTAARLKAFNPDTRLLAILRNPAERAYSAYLQARKTGHEPVSSFNEAIDYELSGKLLSFKDVTNRSYIAQGKYSKNIRTYYKHFDSDRIKIILYDDLKEHPEATCRDIFDYLSIDGSFTAKISTRNEYGIPRSRLLRDLVKNGIKSPLIREILPINMRIRTRQIVRAFNTRRSEKPVLESSTWQRLDEIYESEIDRLENLLGKDLSSWRNYRPN